MQLFIIKFGRAFDFIGNWTGSCGICRVSRGIYEISHVYAAIAAAVLYFALVFEKLYG